MTTFSGGTIDGSILPTQTGHDLGSAAYRWDGFLQDLNLSGTISGANSLATLDTLTLSKLNNILFVDGTKYTALSGAYAALPSTGGVVIVPPNYTETMAASLTVSKPNTGFVFLGPATITMGTNQIIVTQGTHGVFFKGAVPFGGANLGLGAQFTYSGTSDAFLVGGTTTTTRVFGWNNLTVILSSPAANSTGLRLKNVVYFEIDNPAFVGDNTNGYGMVLDGTGNFTGTGRILNPYSASLATGILGTGTGAQAMNAVSIIGGTLQSSAAGAIGIDIEVGDANVILGTDLESNSIGLKLGAGAKNNHIVIRSEANTTDVSALAGSSHNIVSVFTQPAGTAIVKSDAGTNNHITRAVDGDFDALGVSDTITSTKVGVGGVLINTTAGTGQRFIQLGNTGNTGFYHGIESSVGGTFFTGSAAYESVLYSPSNNLFINTPQIRTTGIFSRYNDIVLVANGIASEIAAVNLTAQTAAVGTTTLYAVPASGAGQYRLAWNAKVTTPATTGAATSTLGGLTIVYTDPDGVVQTITAQGQTPGGTIVSSNGGNTTTSSVLGFPLLLNAKASTNITYAMAYASDTANQMAYNLHILLEKL